MGVVYAVRVNMKVLLLLAALVAVSFAKECRDHFVRCPILARMGNCRRHPREMKKMCTLSCRYCKPGPKPDVGPTLAPGTCGKPTPMGSRIIGGEFAKKDAWPWQVAIYYMRKTNTNGQSNHWRRICQEGCVAMASSHLLHGSVYVWWITVVPDMDHDCSSLCGWI